MTLENRFQVLFMVFFYISQGKVLILCLPGCTKWQSIGFKMVQE